MLIIQLPDGWIQAGPLVAALLNPQEIAGALLVSFDPRTRKLLLRLGQPIPEHTASVQLELLGMATPHAETSWGKGSIVLLDSNGVHLAAPLLLETSSVSAGQLVLKTPWSVNIEARSPGVLTSSCFEFITSSRLQPG